MKRSQPVAFALASFLQLVIFYGLYLGLSYGVTTPPRLPTVSVELISEGTDDTFKPKTAAPKVKPVVENTVANPIKPHRPVEPVINSTPSETAPTVAMPQQTQSAVATTTNDAPIVASVPVQAQSPPPTPPRFDADYLNNPKPQYPALSSRLNEVGTTRVRVLVKSDGTVGEVRLETSSGHSRLDEAALKAIAAWRFIPARRGGEAVADWVIVPMTFNL